VKASCIGARDAIDVDASAAAPKCPRDPLQPVVTSRVAHMPMVKPRTPAPRTAAPIALALPKTPTGIRGLDEITGGGLPTGRPTLVAGGAGCGKTLLSMEFLLHGATEFGEPGVCIAFEETADELAANVASLGFDLKALIADRKIAVDYVLVERSDIEEVGDYDLEGLFIRIEHAITSVGAKRIVLDTVEALFSALPNTHILRAELRRLFRRLKDRGMTAVITGQRGDGTLTRHGIEEYVSDCVIVLDDRVSDQLSTRRPRIAKYRGSFHGTNEYPFLIDTRGISVLPVTSMDLDHVASTERISSGVPQLDAMLGGLGYFRGSSILISGMAGSGKTSLAALFADATCRRGERCLTFLFEESPSQLLRNTRSIGLDLKPWLDEGLLLLHAGRPCLFGLEMHLSTMLQLIEAFAPRVVIIDPITSLAAAGNAAEVRAMVRRLMDLLKNAGITTLLVNMAGADGSLEATDAEISSLIDAWLILRDLETNGERTRGMYVLKSRGMAHSNQIREFTMSAPGVELREAYVGPAGVLTGTARSQQEARDVAERADSEELVRQQLAVLEYKRQAVEAQVAALRSGLAADNVELERALLMTEQRTQRFSTDRTLMRHARQPEPVAPAPPEPASRRTETRRDDE